MGNLWRRSKIGARAPVNKCGMFAFRTNLPQVTAWLQQLKEDTDSLGQTLVWQIEAMLRKEPENRALLEDVVKHLMVNRESFYFALIIDDIRRQWSDRIERRPLSISYIHRLHARAIALLMSHSPSCFCLIYSTAYMPTKVSLQSRCTLAF